jgi:hypothetical protein
LGFRRYSSNSGRSESIYPKNTSSSIGQLGLWTAPLLLAMDQLVRRRRCCDYVRARRSGGLTITYNAHYFRGSSTAGAVYLITIGRSRANPFSILTEKRRGSAPYLCGLRPYATGRTVSCPQTALRNNTFAGDLSRFCEPGNRRCPLHKNNTICTDSTGTG